MEDAKSKNVFEKKVKVSKKQHLHKFHTFFLNDVQLKKI